MWTFKQRTGELLRNGVQVGVGYSGHDKGKNDPDMQHVPRVGPIPVGLYEIGEPFDSSSHGPYVMRLTPHPENEMFGRDGFLMHGDSKLSPGTASLGCIIQSHDVRTLVGKRLLLGETTLEVVRGDGVQKG
jgi:hypothetical protein